MGMKWTDFVKQQPDNVRQKIIATKAGIGSSSLPGLLPFTQCFNFEKRKLSALYLSYLLALPPFFSHIIVASS